VADAFQRKLELGRALPYFVSFVWPRNIPNSIVAKDLCITTDSQLVKKLYNFVDRTGYFMDIFSYESARRIGNQNALRKVDALMDWSTISVLLKNGLKRSGHGLQGYKEITLFKCLLIRQRHKLSDPKLQQSLRVHFDFMLFAGLHLHGSVPDETTHCRFSNALVKADAYDALFAEVCRQIKNHGLKVKEAAAGIIDATWIESAAHPRN
jgi:IS5 family transposase